MLELRYNRTTGEVTGWCADVSQFGNLKVRENEAIILANIPLPPLSCQYYKWENGQLIQVDTPIPPRDIIAEIDEVKQRVGDLEGRR